MQETKDGATMVVFSGDLDKARASFIISKVQKMGVKIAACTMSMAITGIKE